MENEFDTEEDIAEPFTSVSDRDNYYIWHKAPVTKEHYKFGKVSAKPRWPDKLWNNGLLVYSIKDKTKCLSPPTSPDDTTLRFDSRFESGNLSRAYRLSEDSYHLILEYDHNTMGTCQWFYFKISNVKTSIKYTFYISGFHKETSLFSTGARVHMYSEKRAKFENVGWTHTGSKYAYSVTSRTKSKKKRATVQFRTRFPYDDDVCYFCHSLPYTYTDLQRNILKWKHKSPQILVESEVVCQSFCGRDIPYLTITRPNSSIPIAGKSCIFLTGRIHPGESNGSFVLHGLLDFLLSEDPMAKYILDHNIVRVVPMINVDGVVEGSYRCSMTGHDLNRMWGQPNQVLNPEIYHTKELIARTATERPVIAYIDFHGHSSLHGTFAYGCPNPENDLKDTEKTFPRLFSYLADDFSWEHCVFTFPKDRADAGRIVVRKEMGVVQSFTIETSFGGVKAGLHAGFLYDAALWNGLGASCGRALFHLLRPTQSPLVDYVNKELVYFAPNGMKGHRQEEAKKANSAEVRFEEEKEEEKVTDKTIEKKEQGGMKKLVVDEPRKFLNFDISGFSVSPPKVIQPKWEQMKYKM